ncbi:MAG: hypothetical protein KatS3mg068_1244 [Candidatus Sericytochromatia bacterium]|nr:MAG: hypothetical protein KatS3mg068_1244 [Candidatus Sericytochromatia bacterium]
MSKKFSYSILCLAVMGCSTSTNIIPTKDVKIDSVKVNQVNVIDLGNKNGASVKANFSFAKDKTHFGIKAETNADLVGTINCVKVFLMGVTNGEPKPNLLTRTLSGIFRDIGVAGSLFTLTFSGLAPGKDYYVAAQAYSGGCTAGVNETSVDGTSISTNGGGTAGALGIVYPPSENSANEEFVSVSPAGVPNVLNDVSTPDTLDISIQLRKSKNAAVTGSANVVNGQPPDAEDITSP